MSTKMAGLLSFNVEQRQRGLRRFRLPPNPGIDGFTDAELRARYRFREPQPLFVFRHKALTASVISTHISFFRLFVTLFVSLL